MSLTAAPALAAGLALPALLAGGTVGQIAFTLLTVLVVLACHRLSPAHALACVVVAACGAFWTTDGLAELRADPLGRLRGQVHGVATVTGSPRQSLHDTVALASFDGYPVELRTPMPVAQGEVLSVEGKLSEVPARITDGFDRREWLARKGIHELLRAKIVTHIGVRGGVFGLADRAQSSIRRTLGLGTDQPSQVVAGVVLGITGGLTPETTDAFRSSGTAHLLAVSGGNVAILIGSMLTLAFLLRLPRAVGQGASLLVVIGYAFVVGASPSVVRATVAGVLVCLAWLAGRPADRWHILALGAAAVEAYDPYAILGPGFQLSFAAVLAIYLVVPPLVSAMEGRPFPPFTRTPLAMTIACTLATAPISWWHFGQAALLGSAPANLLALLAVAPLLWLAIAAVVVGPVLPGAATALGIALKALGYYLILVAQLGTSIGALPGSIWPNGEGRSPPHSLRVTFLDVGQGSATLVESPGLTLLVDTGRREARVARMLTGRGIHHLDALVLSHPQADHVGGAADILRAMRVDRVIDIGIDGGDIDAADARRTIRTRQVPETTARVGTTLTAAGTQVTLLGPLRIGGGQDPNHEAIVVDVRQRNCSFLLPADAESDSLLALDLRPVGVLNISHHGSADPGLPTLLERLHPQLGVISVGPNSYGHPRAETLAALAAAGVQTKRTDRDGSVTLTCPVRSTGVDPSPTRALVPDRRQRPPDG